MNILVVTFNLEGINEETYRTVAEGVAPAIAAMPGLIGKVWLADRSSNTYGGMYVFESRQSLDGYLASDVVTAMQANPHLINLSVRIFDTIDSATRLTSNQLDLFSYERAA